MILLESSSGEYDTLAKLQELAATDSESEGEGAVDYGQVESSSPSSADDGSYHSDNDELAEYWDPYREYNIDCYCSDNIDDAGRQLLLLL